MNIFKQFYKSIFSPKDIALFRFQGIGKTILYIFLLTLLSILPTVYFFSTTLSAGIESARSIIKDELPSFSIQNGQLSAETTVPITVDKNNFTIILDPTGATTTNNMDDTGNILALLKNDFVITTGGKTETYAYSMINGMKLSNRDLLDFLDAINGIKIIILPVFFMIIYLFSCTASFIEITILALIGLMLKNLLGRNLNFSQLWRMAAYSETLPTVFFTIMAIFKTTVPGSFFLNWIVVIIVLYLAIKETPKSKKIV